MWENYDVIVVGGGNAALCAALAAREAGCRVLVTCDIGTPTCLNPLVTLSSKMPNSPFKSTCDHFSKSSHKAFILLK